jgi:hypothetical protein
VMSGHLHGHHNTAYLPFRKKVDKAYEDPPEKSALITGRAQNSSHRPPPGDLSYAGCDSLLVGTIHFFLQLL